MVSGKEKSRGLSLSFLYALSELLYPRLCVVCGKCLIRGEHFICTSCLSDFPFSDPAVSSGQEVLGIFESSCRPDGLYSLFYYNRHSDYRQLIYAVKYRSKKELGKMLGKMLGQRLQGHVRVDGIVPVPLHPRRQKKRGFNQASQIAAGIAGELQVEVWEEVLVRVRNNASQTTLGPEERRQNVEDIFELREPEKIRGKRLLVVDDVITTGSTIHSCVKALAAAGEVHFTLACLARTLS